MDNNPFSMNWTESWSELQKQMWNDWLAMAGKTGFNPGAPTNPFNFIQQSMAESSDRVWNAFTPFQTKSPEEVARQSIMGAMNNFMNMSKGVFDTYQNMSAKGGTSAEEWVVELDRNLQKFREYFTLPNQTDFGALNPMSGWSKMVENNPAFSNNVMKQFMDGMSGMKGIPPFENMINDTLKMPGLGLNREHQEKVQKAIQLGLEYQKAMADFQKLMNESSLKASDLFRNRLVDMAKEGEALESLRDLHVLWVDCSEETNAKTVASQEYQEINPRLTMALLNLQRHIQSMTDDAMSAFNMPTRKELNSAYLQIHDLKKRVRTLESQLKNQVKQSDTAKLNRLRDDVEKLDIESLRKDVAELKRQSKTGGAAAAKPAAKTPAAKTATKTTTRKAAAKPAATTKPQAKAATTRKTKAAATKPSTKKGA